MVHHNIGTRVSYEVKEYEACAFLCHHILLKVGCIEIELGGQRRINACQ